MLFLIPLLAVAGGAAAAKGAIDIAESRAVVARAKSDHVCAGHALKAKAEKVNDRAEVHGHALLAAQQRVILPMARWIENTSGTAGVTEVEFLRRVDLHLPARSHAPGLGEYGSQVAAGTVVAAATAMAAPGAISAMVGLFGTASTGVAISSLSGVAASNATLAALGGGSLAAGGGGIAAGEALLGAAMPVVGLFMLGGTVLIAGDRARTDASEFAAEVARAIAELEVRSELLGRLHDRFDEVGDVLDRLSRRAAHAQQELFAIEGFDPGTHALAFARAMQLTRAVAQVLRTPVVDPDTLELNAQMARLLRDFEERL